MQKMLRRAPAMLLGAAYGALAVCLSRLLIVRLGDLVSLIGGMTALDESVVGLAAYALSQLVHAQIVSPIVPAMLLGALAGLLLNPPQRRRILSRVCLGALLLLPLTLLALWFTVVNDVQVGALVSVLLPMLSRLL